MGGGTQTSPLDSLSINVIDASGTYYIKVGGTVGVAPNPQSGGIHVSSVSPTGGGLSVVSVASGGVAKKLTGTVQAKTYTCNMTNFAGTTSYGSFTIIGVEVHTYSLSYNAKGGSGAPNTQTADSPESSYTFIVSDTIPTKSGYIFQGWDTQYAATTVKYVGGQSITISWVADGGQITLYAVWVQSYKVTLSKSPSSSAGQITSGGTEISSIDVPTGTIFRIGSYNNQIRFSYNNTLIVATGLESYHFENWTINGSVYEGEQRTVTSAITIVANFSLPKYTVTLISSPYGIASFDSKEVQEGTTWSTSGRYLYITGFSSVYAPTVTGYTFNKWADSSDATSGTIYSPTTIIAKYTANTYRVYFNTNGGGSVSPTYKDVTYDSTYGTLPTPDWTDHVFIGWFTSSTGGTQVTSSTTVDITSSQTLYAHWQNHFELTYYQNGGSGTTYTQTGNSTSTSYSFRVPTISYTRTGYTLSGWSDSSSATSPTYVTGSYITVSTSGSSTSAYKYVYAVWTAKTYTVTLNDDGGSGGSGSITATYDQLLPSVNIPTRTDMEFQGYYYQTTGSQYINSNGNGSKYWDIDGSATLVAKWAEKGYMYIRNSTQWKQGVVYIYTSGGWKVGVPYVYTSNGWKRT